MPLFNSDILVNVDQHPGFISGKYYAYSPFVSSSVNSGGTSGLAANSLIYVPMFIPKNITIDRLWLRVQSAVTSSLTRLGIYNNLNGLPSSLLVDAGEIDTSSPATKEAIISTFLGIGWYWIASNCSVSPNILAAATMMGMEHFLGFPSTYLSPAAYCYMQSSVTYGPLPTTAPVSNLAARSTAPFFKFRVA
ncbi:hypothetical protein BV372_08010 [Nostoc sp. T09]|uniref:hypothetical protein n=1 Tax=Nostoc sp. T09 TaxID=1932621 RepID=UPI000A3B2B3E|nr:hypothetical protein [Nostoc sp. T09]OUL36353.1 hypothetical protein BV372_08010 [Nostoc sp. T09]